MLTKTTSLLWSYEGTFEPSKVWHRYFITLTQRIKIEFMFMRFVYGIAILFSINFYGCDSKPKVIVEDSSEVPQNAPVNPNQDAQPSEVVQWCKMDVHQVKP